MLSEFLWEITLVNVNLQICRKPKEKKEKDVYKMFKFVSENICKKLIFGSLTDYDLEKELLTVSTRAGDMTFKCISQKLLGVNRGQPVVIFSLSENIKKSLPEVINMYNDDVNPKEIDAIQIVLSKLEA
jgi:hypothetical protein